MRIPLSWLKEFVEINLSIEELSDRLTFSGIEVSNIESIGIYNPNVICGKLLSKKIVEKKNGVFHLSIDIGNSVVKTVSNAKELNTLTIGKQLAIALPNSILFESGNENYFTKVIVQSEIYNLSCECSICSIKELGVGDDNEKLFIVDESISPGSKLIDFIEAESNWDADQILTIEILANIARCQSIIGVSKEVAAITRQHGNFNLETLSLPVVPEKFQITNLVPELVKRFSVVNIDNIIIEESPKIIKKRLSLCGITPINNIIDLGNYVMLELGQPLHIYDANKLNGFQIDINLSTSKVPFTPLSNSDTKIVLHLPEDLILINNSEKVIAIGGIIGSDDSAITESTNSIIIESANYNFISIRKAQNKLKIYTEASSRFSRGVSFDLNRIAIERFLKLLSLTNKNLSIANITNFENNQSFKKTEIELNVNELNNSLGTDFDEVEVGELLNFVDIKMQKSSDSNLFVAQIPLSRQDITIVNDLYEEVARLIGYDRMPTTMPIVPIPMHQINHHLRVREQIRDAMVLSGLNEIITYSMTSEDIENKLMLTSKYSNAFKKYVSLKNSISLDKTVMRTTLISGLLNTIEYNLKYTNSCSFFEIGNIFFFEKNSSPSELPNEPLYMSIGFSGQDEEEGFHQKNSKQYNYFNLKSCVENLFRHLHINNFQIEECDEPGQIYQPGQYAKITNGNIVYGYLGKVHPFVCNKYNLEKKSVYCAEINLEKIIEDSIRFFVFEEPNKFPSIQVDISIIIDDKVKASEVISKIKDLGIPTIKNIDIFDLYKDSSLGELKKSFSLRIILNATNRTLLQEEANSIRDNILNCLKTYFEATLRI